ncbi:hypothetical protein [Clostridium uliginosum]|uniref:Uncharacterized protein n=1 Tax=Clostridium uliginosum TaxID=119641 RepID=A0A1I1RWZ0_9CLOT|nr:hypothetical protein [Clostridium uliginosum]SFD38771.1 hypothetical protein SAMN05421842_1405 [Clostridium uliginosum]
MINSKIKICRMILIFCIIIPILFLLFKILYRNDYKSISYSIIPILISVTGLISSYSSSKHKKY